MTKAELDSKHIAELHALAAEAGVPKYRMLRREELIEALAAGGESKPATKPERKPRKPREPRQSPERRERAPRRRRERPAREEREERPAREEAPAREEVPASEEAEKKPAPAPAPATTTAAPPRPGASAERPRRRRRRRFGRKPKGVAATDLLLPPPGRQALVYGESAEACTAMLREIAAELSGASKGGPDPIVLLVDPSPEELADWKREAPRAEIVAAAQARHASDALAQAARRAEAGEDVVLLVDSLSKLEDADVAKEIFDGAQGSLTVVAALVRD